MHNQPKNYYYANPAFCQQSEFYNARTVQRHQRQSPVGAQVDEQDFYEEMLVDDAGVVKEKKVLVVSSPGKEATLPHSPPKTKHRYEYIPMQEQNRYVGPRATVVHRYAIIETADEHFHPSPNPSHRYEYIQDHHPHVPPSSPRRIMNPNPIATQKLHELLTTPKKSPMIVHQQRHLPPTPPNRDPFATPPKRPSAPARPKAQQKLNYAIGTRHMQPMDNKRHTAIVAPMCSSPIQSVYSETTFSQKSDNSWMNLEPQRKPMQVTLAVAAVMMVLCGAVTTGLCFYMVSKMGRPYFLDFGIVAGFACFILGLLGFRTRNCYWLPNRNYISGYILLSVFSLLMCSGLLVLLVVQPRPGTPLADMTSGAVCGISVLSLVLAGAGVFTSYCCKYPPPDNRVQHSVPGFTV